MQACPTAWWKPTGIWLELMDEMNSMLDGVCQTILITGGNGPGKTFFIINALAIPFLHKDGSTLNPYVARWPFMQKRTKIMRETGFETPGTHHIGFVMPTGALETAFLPKLSQWAPKGSYTTHNAGTTQRRRIKFQEGGVMTIFSPNQELKEQAGGDLDCVLASEPFPPRMLGEMRGRLRESGFIFMENCPDWNIDAAKMVQICSLMKPEKVIMKPIHKATACFEHEINGFLRHDKIKQGIEQIKAETPESVSARVAGISMHYAGRIFPLFDKVDHVWPEDKCIKELRESGATFWNGIDPHDNKPYASLWIAIDPQKRLFIVDECPRWEKAAPFVTSDDWFKQAMSPSPQPFHLLKKDWADNYAKICQVLHQVEEDMFDRYAGMKLPNGEHVYSNINPKVIMHYMDPRPSSRGQRTGIGKTSALAEMRKYGIPYKMVFAKSPQEGFLEWRHRMIRGLLSRVDVYTDEEIRSGKIVDISQIIISDRCQNFIYAMENISALPIMKHGAKVGDEEVRKENKIDEDLKHFIDCLGYILQRKPYHIPRCSEGQLEEKRIREIMENQRILHHDQNIIRPYSGDAAFVCN